ncbi:MAG: hypothetical protein WBG70_23190 [Spirulinaceae cyanobacterium]
MLQRILETNFKKLSRLNVGLLLGVGLVATTAAPLFAYNLQNHESAQQQRMYESMVAVLEAERNGVPDATTSLANGNYLYGRSPQPDVLGAEYLVFQVRNNKVVGAFYVPQSEFSCFYGSVEPQKMDIAVVDPYEDKAYPYSVALKSQSTVAKEGNPDLPEVGLDGYQPLNQLSDNDLRMLNTCVQEYQQEVW